MRFTTYVKGICDCGGDVIWMEGEEQAWKCLDCGKWYLSVGQEAAFNISDCLFIGAEEDFPSGYDLFFDYWTSPCPSGMLYVKESEEL